MTIQTVAVQQQQDQLGIADDAHLVKELAEYH